VGEHAVVVRRHDRDERFAVVTLDRPERRNALALDVMVELTAALCEVGGSDADGVILAANGPVFSAGHDFRDMHGADLSSVRRLFEVCTEMMDTIQSIPQPVIAISSARLRPTLRATATSGVWQNNPPLPPGIANPADSAAIARSHDATS
jgi:enoyl-CoA hydratase/carnithine racemase